jgi:PAS domain-containing protein
MGCVPPDPMMVGIGMCIFILKYMDVMDFTGMDDKSKSDELEALNEQIEFLQTLIDNLPQPVFYKDAQGRYLGCNKAFEAFTGNPREQLIGKTVFQVAGPERAKIIDEAEQRLYASRIPQRRGPRMHPQHPPERPA